MKTKILAILLAILSSAVYSQSFKSVEVYQNTRRGLQAQVQSIKDSGWVMMDSVSGKLSIASSKDYMIIEGHSMKKLGNNKYRFHQYNRENKDFEIEFFQGYIVLHTRLALGFSGYRYTSIFNCGSQQLDSEKVANELAQR